MAGEKKPSIELDKTREGKLMRDLRDGIDRFQEWGVKQGFPSNATVFDLIARHEGWSEETIQRERTLLEIGALLESCVDRREKEWALHHARLALGLSSSPPRSLALPAEKKAEAMRVVGWILWSWRNWRPPPGHSERRKWEQREAETLIARLAEIRPKFSNLRRADVLVRLGKVNGKTSAQAFLRGLADRVGEWPGDQESLKKARQRKS